MNTDQHIQTIISIANYTVVIDDYEMEDESDSDSESSEDDQPLFNLQTFVITNPFFAR